MPNLTHVVPGEPFKPSASDWNTFVDTARTVQSRRVIFGPGQLPPDNIKPELFISLQDFGVLAGGGPIDCVSTADAAVGLAAKLLYQPELGYLPSQKVSYMRDEGEVVCCWQPAETGCNTARTKIRCGEYFWAMWNGQSGRYEAISNGRNDSDSTNNDANCPCKWWGFAIWEVQLVASVNTWVLIDNRCSGCYHDTAETPERSEITASLRFLVTSSNDDLIETPTADATLFDVGDRYVTCCGVPDDDPPPPPCDLTCCYSVPLPYPSCTDTSIVSQAILSPVGGSSNCTWSSGANLPMWRDTIPDCCPSYPDTTFDIYMSALIGMVTTLTGTTLTYQVTLTWGYTPGTFVAVCQGTGTGYIHVEYDISPDPDCTNDPTGTRTKFQHTFAAGKPDACPLCDRDMAYISSLFPSSISVTRIACDETTTTNTSTSTSTTTSTTSTTTGSTTTGSTTTNSTTTGTTGSTTTGTTGSTTGSTTTNTSTTTASSTSSTTAACTGLCDYQVTGIGDGTSPTGFYWFVAGNSCSSGCGCLTNSGGDTALATAIGRWPSSLADSAQLSCR